MTLLSILVWFCLWIVLPFLVLLVNGVAAFGIYAIASRREWNTEIVIVVTVSVFAAIAVDLLFVGLVTGW